MDSREELLQIAERLESIRDSPALQSAINVMSKLDAVADEADRAFCGSWLGYHASVYYKDLAAPPPGAHFSQEWGLQDMSFSSLGTVGEWREFEPQALGTFLRKKCGNPDLNTVKAAAQSAQETFDSAKSDLRSILLNEKTDGNEEFLGQLLREINVTRHFTPNEIAGHLSPKGSTICRDMVAIGQGIRVPPHIAIKVEIASIRTPFDACGKLASISRKAASHLNRKITRSTEPPCIGSKIFIGHGHSKAWLVLKDFIQDRLRLPWDEFNRVPVAGVTNQARLSEMLDSAILALVIMTAEDETSEGPMQARMNVIHEVGLFQGRLGFTRAIVLFEDGCKEFTNIQGLGQIRFPANNIAVCFEDVRRVLEREGIIAP